MKRLIMIEIEGDDKNKVDRVADLLADQLGLAITFIQAANEYFNQEASVPNPFTILVTSTAAHPA